jgi:RND family efflux transporter MFP subunit
MMRAMPNPGTPLPPWRRAAAVLLAAAALSLAAAVAGAQPPPASAAVELRDVEDFYAADAVIESLRQATVSAQIAGQLTALYVDAGDRVRRGQLLARIDAREADAQVASARAQVGQAEAALAQARLSYDRTKSLVAQNFLSQSALDKADADLKTAQAALDAARAGTAQATTGRSFAELRAPIDGVVSRRLMEPGELATPGRGVIEIHDPTALRAVGTIPQFVLPRTARVERAEVDLASVQRRVTASRVTVLPAADPRLLSTQVRADLPADAPAGIVPGTAAKVLLPVGRSRKLVVPAAAVFRRGELTAVYVLADNARQLRQVRVGNRVDADSVEVLAGLSAGERVALDVLRGTGAI